MTSFLLHGSIPGREKEIALLQSFHLTYPIDT